MWYRCLEMPDCAWHRVRSGESLADIARLYGVQPFCLLDLNPYLDPAELIEGLPILVPAVHPFGHAAYGESLDSLLGKTGLSRDAFEALNPGLAGRPPLPGQRYRGF